MTETRLFPGEVARSGQCPPHFAGRFSPNWRWVRAPRTQRLSDFAL